MNFEDFFDIDILYRKSEYKANIAEEHFKKGRMHDAFLHMSDAVDCLRWYKEHAKRFVTGLDFEINVYETMLKYYMAADFINQDRYVLCEKNAREAIRLANSLGNATCHHARIKIERAKKNLYDLIGMAQFSRNQENSRYIDLLNDRDAANILGNEKRANQISALIDMLEIEK